MDQELIALVVMCPVLGLITSVMGIVTRKYDPYDLPRVMLVGVHLLMVFMALNGIFVQGHLVGLAALVMYGSGWGLPRLLLYLICKFRRVPCPVTAR